MQLVDAGAIARSSSYAEAESAMNEGRVAMSFNGPWAWGNLRASGIDFGVAPGPSIGGRPGGSFVGVLGAMVASGSHWPELAHEFIEEYLLSDEGLRAMDAHVPLGVPANKALYAERAADPRIAGSMAAIRAGELIPSLPEMSRFWSAMSAALQNIIQGREGVDEGLARAALRIRGDAA
jgi:maltose/maltodextrin transport system substrate-binding protein